MKSVVFGVFTSLILSGTAFAQSQKFQPGSLDLDGGTGATDGYGTVEVISETPYDDGASSYDLSNCIDVGNGVMECMDEGPVVDESYYNQPGRLDLSVSPAAGQTLTPAEIEALQSK